MAREQLAQADDVRGIETVSRWAECKGKLVLKVSFDSRLIHSRCGRPHLDTGRTLWVLRSTVCALPNGAIGNRRRKRLSAPRDSFRRLYSASVALLIRRHLRDRGVLEVHEQIGG